MITIRSSYYKTFLLLFVSTLFIGLGATLSWKSPGQNSEFNDDFDLIVENQTSSGSIDFYFKEPSSNQFEFHDSASLNNGTATTTFSPGDTAESGTHEFKANSSNDETETRSVLIDLENPSVSFSDDPEFVDNPSLSVTLEDSYSGVNSVSVSATGSASAEVTSDDCSSSSSCTADIDVDTSDVNEGDSFDLQVTAGDSVGNSNQESTQLTKDSTYDGDSSADVEWENSEEGNTVLSGYGDESQDVLLSLDADSVSDTTVTCEVDGDEVDTDSNSPGDGEEEFSCSIDTEYSNQVFDLTVTAEDEAGHEETVLEDEEMIWDTESPKISELSHEMDVNTFNSNFNLSFTASDEASGLDTVEYFFDETTQIGDGNEIDIEENSEGEVNEEFEVDASSLSQDNHTVFVRAVDGVGKAGLSEFDFEFYPNRDPKVNLNSIDSMEIISGDTKSFEVTIENAAPFFLNGVEITGNEAVWGGEKTVSNLEEGDSATKRITIDSSNLDIGVYELKLETSTGDSKDVEITVNANEDQQSEINSSLQKWKKKMNELNDNISRIKTLESENENITQFTEKVRNAEAAVNKSKYYEARSSLNNIQSSFDKASKTYKEMEELHKEKQRNQMIMIFAVFLVFSTGAGIGGLLYYREEQVEHLVPDDFEFEVPEVLADNELMNRVREFLNEAEEEVEEETGYSFEGFN